MAPIGGLLALLITHTHFSVSSGVGFLALFGVAVQTSVIMLEYINQLRARGEAILSAAVNGSVQRLRPIMMTMLVASVGLLPPAMSRGIGSDSQRPFAIVIVGGLMAALILGVFLLPTLHVWVAGEARCAAGAGSEGGGRVGAETADRPSRWGLLRLAQSADKSCRLVREDLPTASSHVGERLQYKR